MRRGTLCLLVSLLLAPGLDSQELRKKPGSPELEALPKTRANRVSGDALGVGAVQYDPGIPADGLLLSPSTWYFGNRFNTRNGAPLSPGTITQVSWYQGNAGINPNQTFFIFHAPPSGSVFSDILVGTGPATFVFNSAPVSVPVASDFVVGFEAYQTAGGAAFFGSVGLRSASTNAQGFHGIQRSFFGNTNTLPGQNVMVRVSGNIVIPVELLEFEVE